MDYQTLYEHTITRALKCQTLSCAVCRKRERMHTFPNKWTEDAQGQSAVVVELKLY